MTATHAHRLAAAGLLCLALAACSITTEGDGDDGGSADTTPSTEQRTDTDPDEGTTESRTPDVITAEQVWLYEVPSDANFDSGGQVDVVVAGGDGANHPDSTAQWLGCDGVAAVTTYALDGRYSMLDGTLAFREGTPAAVVAEVSIATDLGVLGSYRIESDGGVPLQLVLDGAEELVVTAEVSEGECEVDDDAYLVFVDAVVTR